ncbi:hypothetical protein B0O99DRAFT_693382 [Bisporella sp. PMI_857]|nr:hypothetical protein B0O99DRAFT_693382 [Bisporella sp. PMI_857]
MPELERQANEAAKKCHDAVRRQKKAHWEDFPSDDTNIWQSAKYLNPSGSLVFDKIPPLTKRDELSSEDEERQNDPTALAKSRPQQYLSKSQRRSVSFTRDISDALPPPPESSKGNEPQRYPFPSDGLLHSREVTRAIQHRALSTPLAMLQQDRHRDL